MSPPLITSILNWEYLNYLTFSLGVILAIIGIFASIHSLRRKIPIYAIENRILIQNFHPALPNLSIKFKNENVKNLAISRIAFWNAGKDTINKSDISSAEPLKVIISSDSKIMDVNPIFTANSANQFEITKVEEKSFDFTFDFFDHQDGAIIQIIHDSNHSDPFIVSGFIKGAGRPKLKKIRTKLLSTIYIPFFGQRKFSQRYIGYALSGILGLFVLFSIYGLLFEPDGLRNLIPIIFFCIMFIIFTYTSIPQIPKELEIIEELDK